MKTHTQPSADSLPPSTPETTGGPPPLQWLVPERIPLGRITLLTGPVDSGKTAVAADIAYKIARAMPWPMTGDQPAAEGATADSRPNSAPKATVLFLTPFQDPQETALARQLAATGRPENIAMTAPEWKGESPLATLVTQLDRAFQMPEHKTGGHRPDGAAGFHGPGTGATIVGTYSAIRRHGTAPKCFDSGCHAFGWQMDVQPAAVATVRPGHGRVCDVV